MAKLRCMGCMREYEEKKKCCPYCGYTINAKQEYAFALQPQTVLQARYIVGTVLRCGKEEIIYLGWDQVLDKRIAIKEYYPQLILTRDEGQRQVCLQEPDAENEYRKGKEQYISDAKELARFREETGIIRIYDYFEQNGTVYVITEYSENYRRKDVATRMLYQKTGRRNRRKYVWRILFGVELVAGIAVFAVAWILWQRSYSFVASSYALTQRMPDVTGEEYEQAKQELEQLGLQVQQKNYNVAGVGKGIVVTQSEQSGEPVSDNMTVILWVSDEEDITDMESGEQRDHNTETITKDMSGENVEDPNVTTTSSEEDTGTTRQESAVTRAKTATRTDSTQAEKTTEKKAGKKTTKKSTEATTQTTTEVIVIED